ncbi:RNA polymerase I-specific transcription initiation factor-domain-containing protein [Aspergillus granulosus]|uniref:RNA polymerase I-specific transcription initiation factor-domain-containing protein n=1 Tax=Aspergillus granulosus TaxID=176169 RepID=A0ABR4GZN0_9EURO
MSFFSDDQILHSSAPPSAQPYRSLFGGSSQDVVDQEQQSRFHGDESLGYADVGATTSGGPDTADEEYDDDNAYLSEIETYELPQNDNSSLAGHSDTYMKSTFEGREYPESSQSPPPYRPNRFHGPADMWLKLTRDDREIVEALEETRARDLAAHLYNAYTLQSQGVAKLKNTDGLENDALGDTFPLGSLEQWTAWPMPSDEVPRLDERLRRLEDDKWTYKLKPDPRPSAALEECIMSFLLRAAKDRFRSRDWDSATRAKKANIGPLEYDGVGAKKEGGFESDGQSTDARRRAHRRGIDDKRSDTEWESEQESLRPLQRPTFQIDEDVSRQKLRPLARNIITHFDQLLMGLHNFHGPLVSEGRSRSRGRKRGRSSSWASEKSSTHSGYAQLDVSEAESNPNVVDVSSRSASARKKGTKSKLARSHSRGRKQSRTAPLTQLASNKAGGVQTLGPRPTSRASQTQSGLTDWKDVLGVASIVGLPPSVLRRATDRFSALSNETTEVPSLPEGPGEYFMEDVLRWASAQDNQAASEGGNFLQSDLASQSPESCASDIGEHSTSPEDERPNKANPSKENNAYSEKILVCPFKKCSRHDKGFSRVWNLNQHLKNMHPNYQPRKDNQRKRRGAQSGYESDQSE